MTRLTILHVRDNRIDHLDGLNEIMVALQYMNVRNNGVVDMKEVAKLKALPMLRALVLDGLFCDYWYVTFLLAISLRRKPRSRRRRLSY
eukprot:m.74090 g.74090  ORF g.74090 m.74090 type:complete len:89 (+) comp35876_c0_seq7:761-1027(+)